ncbi:MAG: TonB family protein [Flavobacteriales bacterium]|nr:TonB family protein [Flavobacteriales bacterium]
MKTTSSVSEKRRPLLFTAGLLTALSLTLVAFEWRTPLVVPTITLDRAMEGEPWEIPPILLEPIDRKKERPAPPPTKTTEVAVTKDVSEPDNTEPNIMEPDDSLLTASAGSVDEPEEQEPPYVPPYVPFPEVLPSFCGGEDAMFKKIHDNIRYPEVPLRNGVSGKVYITFTVMADGTLGDVKVARSVDPWLDAEALRVVKLLDCFTPGMQGGRPVHVPFSIPIHFKLK